MIICVDGNIGCGKTTLLNKLSELGYFTKCEPVDEWEDLLEKYYYNRKKYSFELQYKILNSLYNQYMNIDVNRVVFIERSVRSCIDVFCKTSYTNGELTAKEFNLLKSFSNNITRPDVTIYIDTNVNIYV